MVTPGFDDRSAERKATDERIASEPPLPRPDLLVGAEGTPLESASRRRDTPTQTLSELDRESIVAHHEAGHAVVGFILGAHVGAITLEALKHSTMEWDGIAEVDTTGLDDIKIAEIALAGPLAEMKIRCALESGIPVELDFTLDKDIVAGMIAAMDQIARDPHALPKYLNAAIIADGCRYYSRLHLGDCVEDITTAKNRVGNLHDAATQVLRQMNDARVWNLVRKVASVVLQSKERTLLRKTASAIRVNSVLSSARDLAAT